MVEDVLDAKPFKIGEILRHPDGYDVKIVDGQYWGERGLSNFWSWKRVMPDGSLSKTVEHGYGWERCDPENDSAAPSP